MGLLIVSDIPKRKKVKVEKDEDDDVIDISSEEEEEEEEEDAAPSIWEGGYGRFMNMRIRMAELVGGVDIVRNYLLPPTFKVDDITPPLAAILAKMKVEIPKMRLGASIVDTIQKLRPKYGDTPKMLAIYMGMGALFPHSDCHGTWTLEECEQVRAFIDFCKERARSFATPSSKLAKSVQMEADKDITRLKQGLDRTIAAKLGALFC